MACVHVAKNCLGYCPAISNELLYRRCDTQPLLEMVAEARWKMLGHVLHLPTDTPVQLAMLFALNGGGGMKVRKAVCIQVVKVQVLCSRLWVAFESPTTPVGTVWMCGANCQVFELYSDQLGDLCCKRNPLGLICLCSCPLLLAGAPSVSVLESYLFLLCRPVGIYCMGSDILLLIFSPWTRGR